MARLIRSSFPANSTPMPRRWKRPLMKGSPSKPPRPRKRRVERGRGAGRGADLSAERALRVDIERVDRLARRHKQPVALHAAETEIGATLRQRDAADHDAVGRVDH